MTDMQESVGLRRESSNNALIQSVPRQIGLDALANKISGFVFHDYLSYRARGQSRHMPEAIVRGMGLKNYACGDNFMRNPGILSSHS